MLCFDVQMSKAHVLFIEKWLTESPKKSVQVEGRQGSMAY